MKYIFNHSFKCEFIIDVFYENRNVKFRGKIICEGNSSFIAEDIDVGRIVRWVDCRACLRLALSGVPLQWFAMNDNNVWYHFKFKKQR